MKLVSVLKREWVIFTCGKASVFRYVIRLAAQLARTIYLH